MTTSPRGGTDGFYRIVTSMPVIHRRQPRGWSSNGRLPYSLLAAAVLLVQALPAYAQVIDQYLNPLVRGYGTEPGVTVASRLEPEYDAQGVRVGGFTLSPLLTESVGYDTNVFGTPQAHGSAVVETNAMLNANATWANDVWDAALMVDNSEYPEASQQSSTNWSAATGLSHEFGWDTLTVGATHLNLNQTARDLDSPALQNPIAYRVDDVRASYKINLGRVFIQPGMDVALYSFDNGIVQGLPYLQSYRNRTAYSPSVEGSYELASGRRIIVVLRDTKADFDSAPPGNARENYNDVSALAGLAYDADGVIGFRLLGGYERRDFANQQYRLIQAPIAEGSVTWTPSELTTITGTAARYIEDSAAEATVGYTESTLKLNLDHEYSRAILLNAHGSVTYDDYAQGLGSQSYYTAGASVTYKLDRNLRLVANYNFTTRHTSTPDAVNVLLPFGSVFGSNFADNIFTLQVRLGL